jgi:hypothetical protein
LSRNHLEHPITKEEVLSFLDAEAEDIEMIGAIGGDELYILSCIRKMVDENFGWLQSYLQVKA